MANINLRRFGLAASSLALILGLGACGNDSDGGGSEPSKSAKETKSEEAGEGTFRTLEEIQSSGSIKIGVFYDKAPFGSQDSSGKFVGYDVVYGERIAEDLGVEPEWVPVEAASRVAFLESGKVDLILANFTVTDERAEKVDFVNPYLKVSLGVASPKNAEVTDVAQLNGKDVIVVKGTTAETYLEANNPEVKLVKFEQYTEATSALLDGRGAAWVTDNTEALAWTLQNSDFVTGITSLGPADTIAGAVTKGNDSLKDWLNDHLVKLGEEDFFHKDYEETLKPVYGDAVSPDELVIEGGKL
ncbi:MAG: transporter substrate-binding domain-containing protein [Bifidobacteriaceae bacterium]|jgi:polar amino acid transport system substrate-binding protein|nr:transporter substrate-binding domain-containing protein [Bifidobacteriaceae bacterium]